MNFDFGEVLTRAWKIIWKFKVLWIFGILASCSGGGNGGGSGNNGSSFRGGNQGGFNGGSPNLPPNIQRMIEQIDKNVWVVVAAVICVVIILTVLFIFLGTMGKIGLIKGTLKAEANPALEKMIFGEIWSESLPYFWRVFLIGLLVGLAFLVILLPLILIGVVTAGVGFLCIVPVICILIPVMWVVGMVMTQAEIAIVSDDIGIMDALQRGWEIFKANFGPVIVMALILGIGGGIIGLIISLPILLAVVPIIVGVAASSNSTPSTTSLIIAGVCCAIYLPILIVLRGILVSYIQSAWTLTYLRLTKPAPKDEAPIFIPSNA